MSIIVKSGANSGSLDYAGLTVGEIRNRLGEAYNISASAVAQVNGRAVQDSFEVQDNDTLLFSKAAGEKG